MIERERLMEWLETLPEGSGISISDGGLDLVCDLEPTAYLEVGGVPEDDADDMTAPWNPKLTKTES